MRTLEEMRKLYTNSWYEDYEFEELLELSDLKKIEKFADKLINSWYRTAEKYLEKVSKASCHWKREGFSDKYSYEEYLMEHYPNNGKVLNYIDSNLSDIESRIHYLCKDIMNYEYVLAL